MFRWTVWTGHRSAEGKIDVIRQVDWAWVAMGAVEAHHERPRPEALRTDRVADIAPTGSRAERDRTVKARRPVAGPLATEPILTGST